MDGTESVELRYHPIILGGVTVEELPRTLPVIFPTVDEFLRFKALVQQTANCNGYGENLNAVMLKLCTNLIAHIERERPEWAGGKPRREWWIVRAVRALRTEFKF